MADDSTETNAKEEISGPSPSRRGEEIAKKPEAGQHDEGATGAGRPAGTVDARQSTSINPESEDPIDPSSPNLPPA